MRERSKIESWREEGEKIVEYLGLFVNGGNEIRE